MNTVVLKLKIISNASIWHVNDVNGDTIYTSKHLFIAENWAKQKGYYIIDNQGEI